MGHKDTGTNETKIPVFATKQKSGIGVSNDGGGRRRRFLVLLLITANKASRITSFKREFSR